MTTSISALSDVMHVRRRGGGVTLRIFAVKYPYRAAWLLKMCVQLVPTPCDDRLLTSEASRHVNMLSRHRVRLVNGCTRELCGGALRVDNRRHLE